MKNNRQIGLDGRSFLTACLRRSPKSVIVLIFFGMVSAAADILKLTGASGAAMGSFTTTLLIYDFLAALMLIIVTFYAYFLECGLNIPKLRERPVVMFGCVRLCYYVLLDYYLLYRALYCIANFHTVPASVTVYYCCVFFATFFAILATSFYLNILSRNIIRRSYEKSVRTLSVLGIIFQISVPITFTVARFTMGEFSDEYFTASLCDTLRLGVAPALYLSLWTIFYGAIPQVREVYNEVDDALRHRRYQITYNTEESKKALRKKKSIKKLSPAKKKEIERLAAISAEHERREAAAAAERKKQAAAIAGKPETSAGGRSAAEEKPAAEQAPQEKKPEAAAAEKETGAAAQKNVSPAFAPLVTEKRGKSLSQEQIEKIARNAVRKANQPQQKQVRYAAPGQVEDFDPNAALQPKNRKAQGRPNQGQKRPNGSKGGQGARGKSGNRSSGSGTTTKYYPPKGQQ